MKQVITPGKKNKKVNSKLMYLDRKNEKLKKLKKILNS